VDASELGRLRGMRGLPSIAARCIGLLTPWGGARGSGIRLSVRFWIRTRERHRRTKSKRAEALTRILREYRRRTKEGLGTLFRRLREEKRADAGDEGDQTVYGFDRDLGSAGVNQLTQTLLQIDKALARHGERRYGRCVACNTQFAWVVRFPSRSIAVTVRQWRWRSTLLCGPIE
jgi:RNA polymerase-binding transcription factor DksA